MRTELDTDDAELLAWAALYMGLHAVTVPSNTDRTRLFEYCSSRIGDREGRVILSNVSQEGYPVLTEEAREDIRRQRHLAQNCRMCRRDIRRFELDGKAYHLVRETEPVPCEAQNGRR